MVAPQVVTQRDYVVSIVWRSCVIVPLLWPTQKLELPYMHEKMYLICNIGLAGGKITCCQSACMVVYQPTQEKRGEEKNLSDPAREKLACSLARKIDQN